MNNPTKSKPASTPVTSNPHELLDKPVANPKYNGITLREAFHKVLYQGKYAKKSRIQKIQKS